MAEISRGIPIIQPTLQIKPITYRQACDFISLYHRHHGPPQGCKFCVGAFVNEAMVGCAVCGRPVSRALDHGEICEITRLCTDGTPNACSFLYGACCRIAKAMGYKRIITYTLLSESGASLKASNFVCEGIAGGMKWTGVRDRGQHFPAEMKQRWARQL
jgi:hypothetical protein